MIPTATFRASAPTFSIEPQPVQPQSFSAGQVVKAQVLERLSAEKSLIMIGGVQMQASTEVSVAKGDVLYFTVRSADPLVLQLHGMEYKAVNPFASVESVVRLLNLTSDRLTGVILSHMMSSNQKISKSDVEENRRTIMHLRSEGLSEETDDELLDLIYYLRSKKLPLTPAHLLLARRRVSPDEMGPLSAQLLELLEAADELPASISDPLRKFFTKQRSASSAIRTAVEALGIDYEHSLVRWGVGASDAPNSESLKASLMRLIQFLHDEAPHDSTARLASCAERLLGAIESQQVDALSPMQSDELSLQIPVMIDGSLRTLSLTIMPHAGHGIFQDLPRECSFRMSIDLSELGTVCVSGRLAGRQLSASLTVDQETHARNLEEGFDRLSESLKAEGCIAVSLNARKGIPGASLLRRTVNASA
ncbi:MAG TPA: flagellar hook-length control protein FliK [Bacteroidota bacterium]|nr:flagellar hook-length control protein FliK [Bacteroidota bacterium]